jgi:pSer/pThr/pTyr-binding forkhead associated (FHA) protein/outer membrane protein assembly factor BamB
MPKLIITKKAEVIDEFNLKNGEASYTVGSDSSNDVIIQDKLVSLNHIRIEKKGGQYQVRDLKSAFGTYLNGEKVEDMSLLSNGDMLQLGDHTIIFDNPLEKLGASLSNGSNDMQADRDFDSEMLMQGDAASYQALEEAVREESRLVGTATRVSPNADTVLPYYLLAIYGPYTGKRFQIREGETKIGRDENLNDIVLDKGPNGQADQSISRRHATILHRDGSFSVSDKRSITRTYVNKRVVPTDGEVELFPGDEIEVVSDKQSTIFRFVEEGNYDFRPPRKSGVWWVRYRTKFMAAAAVTCLALSVFFFRNGYEQRSLLTQQPNPLKFDLSYWSTDPSYTLHDGEAEADALLPVVPAVADFNGDGYVDIAATNVTGKPILIDGNERKVRWLVDTMPVADQSSFIAADINENELPDLVYVSQDGRVVAIDGKFGAEIWTSPFFNVELNSPPVVDDFNADGLNDIAVIDVEGTIHIGYNQLMNMQWASIETGKTVDCPLTSADLDGDDIPELLAGSEQGQVIIADVAQARILATLDVNEQMNRVLGSFYEDNQIRHPVGVADLNGDGLNDLVVSSAQGRILAFDVKLERRLWHDVLDNDVAIPASNYPFVLADLNHDEITDVVVASASGEIRAYQGAGQNEAPTLLWSHVPDAAAQASQSFATGDLNKDGVQDIMFVTTDGLLHLLDGRDGKNILDIEQPSNMRTSMPLAADLRKNGLLDIFMMTHKGVVFQFESNSRVPESFVIWNQQYGRSQNTLLATQEIPKPTTANLELLLGVLMFVGAGSTTVLMQKKKH